MITHPGGRSPFATPWARRRPRGRCISSRQPARSACERRAGQGRKDGQGSETPLGSTANLPACSKRWDASAKAGPRWPELGPPGHHPAERVPPASAGVVGAGQHHHHPRTATPPATSIGDTWWFARNLTTTRRGPWPPMALRTAAATGDGSTARASRNACPTGWRLPAPDDWEALSTLDVYAPHGHGVLGKPGEQHQCQRAHPATLRLHAP